MPGVKPGIYVRFTYWPTYMECQVLSLESDISQIYILVYMRGMPGVKPGI